MAFEHTISIVTGPSGATWLQCACTAQFSTQAQADAHLFAVRRWKAHDEQIRNHHACARCGSTVGPRLKVDGEGYVCLGHRAPRRAS